MINTRKTLSTLCLLIMVSISAFSMPALNKVMTQRQSNGKIITYILFGDEFLSYAKTTDNYTLLYNSKGDLVYAYLDKQGNMQASNVLASNFEERSQKEKNFISTLKPNFFYSKQQITTLNKKRVLRDNKNKSLRKEGTSTIGHKKYVVLLVNFSDVTMDTNNAARFHHQIGDSAYTSYGATGSVRDYYYDNSMKQLNCEFDVYGPFTLPHNEAYYGAQTSSGDVDTLPQQMAYDAAQLANSTVDFSQYDNDGDGYVDMVHIIYAGRGQHNGGGSDAIWAHQYYFPAGSSFDGVTLSPYSCSCELDYYGDCDGIGAMCHEMGHVLGLPDFYDTDYGQNGGTSYTSGTWDVMASGSYNNDSKTPPYLSMTERKILAWATPITLTIDTTATLYPLIDSNFAFQINLNDTEYVMLENRIQKKWDNYVPAQGMVVFHGDKNKINNWQAQGNTINVNPNERGYYIEPACGDYTNIESDSTVYPGSRNITNKNNFHLTNGSVVAKSLTNITSNADSTITLHFINNSITFSSTVSNITETTATISGVITGSNATNLTLEYKESSENTYTSINVTPSFTQTITNLSPATTYTYRLTATQGTTVLYGNDNTFTTTCLAQSLPFSETFDSTNAQIPSCWTVESKDITLTQNSDIAQSTHSGQYMLKYNSSWLSAGSTANAVLPLLNIPTGNSRLSFFIYRYYGQYSNTNEQVSIYINDEPNLTNATLIGSISNDRTATPTQTSNGWYNYVADFSQGVAGNKYIIFKFTSQYGYDILLDDISIQSLVGLNSIENDANISLYPNPSKEATTLIVNNINEKAKITLVDVQGRVIMQKDVMPKSGSITTTLDTKDLNQGMYFVKINSNQINTSKQLIVTK